MCFLCIFVHVHFSHFESVVNRFPSRLFKEQFPFSPSSKSAVNVIISMYVNSTAGRVLAGSQ